MLRSASRLCGKGRSSVASPGIVCVCARMFLCEAAFAKLLLQSYARLYPSRAKEFPFKEQTGLCAFTAAASTVPPCAINRKSGKASAEKKGVPNFETPNSLEILKATCARQRTA